ncbi:hypothetical protein [Streptomyces lincolnensis]|uniref:hypothetical protein n=1 Tax=Streptomyces lincolnensis TaxID=1915 RepID=UPI0037D1E81F
MSAAPKFSRAEAERVLGPAVVEKVRRVVDAAPPLRPELREQLRALFQSAREMREVGRQARASPAILSVDLDAQQQSTLS